jgi:hypothetical protein
MPFYPRQHELLEALQRMQVEACTYMGSTCDCKYGAGGRGEETGCPELRTCIALVRSMNVGQYSELLGIPPTPIPQPPRNTGQTPT